MSRRPFDRFMVDVELGSNPKLGRFTDAQFRCLISGVWALAAKSEPRGSLVVAGQPATERDVAYQARCSLAVARSTLARMRELRMLVASEEGFESCRDWHDYNPDPAPSATREAWAERKRTERAKRARKRDVTRDMPVTHDLEVEVEEEEEDKSTTNRAELRSAASGLFAYWQEKCGHPAAKLTADRRSSIQTRLKEGYTADQIRQAIDGAAKAPYVNDQGKRFDDVELICRSGSKLEDFIERATRPTASPTPSSSRGWNDPSRSASLRHRDRWRSMYDDDEDGNAI
jgi:hypothetical protein